MKQLFNPILFLFFLSFSYLPLQAQAQSIDFKQYSISLQKHGQQGVQRLKIKGEEAHRLDVAEYISEYIGSHDISIWGTVTEDEGRSKFYFNSKDLLEGKDCNSFCEELLAIEQKPLLGVAVAPDDNFEGAIVSTVVTNSAADNAGLMTGDLITFIGDYSIHTGCELKISIHQYTVGEEVSVTFIRNGKTKTTMATLGYKLEKKMTWIPCCNTPVEGAAFPTPIAPSTYNSNVKLFPNPTEGISHIHFTSDLEESVQIMITDVNGRLVYSQDVFDFDGTLDQFLDLKEESAGIYFVNIIQGQNTFMERLVLVRN